MDDIMIDINKVTSVVGEKKNPSKNLIMLSGFFCDHCLGFLTTFKTSKMVVIISRTRAATHRPNDQSRSTLTVIRMVSGLLYCDPYINTAINTDTPRRKGKIFSLKFTF